MPLFTPADTYLTNLYFREIEFVDAEFRYHVNSRYLCYCRANLIHLTPGEGVKVYLVVGSLEMIAVNLRVKNRLDIVGCTTKLLKNIQLIITS